MSAHAFLRAATSAAHDQVDALLSDYDLGDPANYGRFLGIQAAVFLPIEQALDAAGAAAVIPDWPDRRRGALLCEDIAALGIELPAPIEAPKFTTSDGILGGVYVLEGSRLGGSMLARSVGAGLPQRFLSGSPLRGGWKSLLSLLEHNLQSVVQREQAANSAIQTFGCFFRAASISEGIR
ncbi:MAG: biliverdin-producing heme oxygenase [Novosphingobium sp.]